MTNSSNTYFDIIWYSKVCDIAIVLQQVSLANIKNLSSIATMTGTESIAKKGLIQNM